MSGILSDEHIAALKEAFDGAAGDDGKLGPDDLKAVLEGQGLKVTDEQVEQIIGAADQDGSGALNFEEFCNGLVTLGKIIVVGIILRKLFEAFDTDGTGKISADNLKQLRDDHGYTDAVSDEQLEAAVAKADTEGDGEVSFEEFLGALIELASE
jgi:Ca2+-binding EF-hand superfamily protein